MSAFSHINLLPTPTPPAAGAAAAAVEASPPQELEVKWNKEMHKLSLAPSTTLIQLKVQLWTLTYVGGYCLHPVLFLNAPNPTLCAFYTVCVLAY